MRLSLSTEAAPRLGLEALDTACRARGLDGQEIGVDADDDLRAIAERVAGSGARVVAVRAASLTARSAGDLARAVARLGVPVSLPWGAVPADELVGFAAVFQAAGARLLLSHGTDLGEVLALLDDIDGAPALGLAWDVRPSTEDLREASEVLRAARPHLGLVRLHGGGAEQGDQDGRGVGPLFVDLALSAYAGPVVLCPSSPDTLPRWARWLASQRSAGCGHRVDPRTLAVDVRGVEPRDRLDTVLGAYRSLAPGDTMRLTVDHDPSCMQFTLAATEPEGSFAFRLLEGGPEVWRAEVTRR